MSHEAVQNTGNQHRGCFVIFGSCTGSCGTLSPGVRPAGWDLQFLAALLRSSDCSRRRLVQGLERLGGLGVESDHAELVSPAHTSSCWCFLLTCTSAGSGAKCAAPWSTDRFWLGPHQPDPAESIIDWALYCVCDRQTPARQHLKPASKV